MIDREFLGTILGDQVRKMQLAPLSIQLALCLVRLVAYRWSKRGTSVHLI